MSDIMNLFGNLPDGSRFWLYGDSRRRWLVKLDSSTAKVEDDGSSIDVDPGAAYSQSEDRGLDDE